MMKLSSSLMFASFTSFEGDVNIVPTSEEQAPIYRIDQTTGCRSIL